MSHNTRQGLPQPIELLECDAWGRLTANIGPGPWALKGTIVQIKEWTPKSGTKGREWNRDMYDTDYRIERWTWQVVRKFSFNSFHDCGGVFIPSAYLEPPVGNGFYKDGEKVKLAQPITLKYRHIKYNFSAGYKAIVVKQTTRKAGNRVHSATEPEQAVWEVQFGLEESKWVGERYDLAVDIRDVSGVPTNSKHVPNIHQPPSFTIRNLW